MRNGWTRQRRLWAPPLVLCLVALVGLGVFQVLFADEARLGAQGVSSRRERLQSLEQQRQQMEALANRAQRNSKRLVRFYEKTLGSEEERLTEIIAEVKDLAQKAGLRPTVIRYPDTSIETFGLVSRSIEFSVDGSYVALRRFVNLLELSGSFLSLDEIRPNEAPEGQLRISLRISTLMLQEGLSGARLAVRRPTETAARETSS